MCCGQLWSSGGHSTNACLAFGRRLVSTLRALTARDAPAQSPSLKIWKPHVELPAAENRVDQRGDRRTLEDHRQQVLAMMSVLKGRVSPKAAARIILALYIGGAVATVLLAVTDLGGRFPLGDLGVRVAMRRVAIVHRPLGPH